VPLPYRHSGLVQYFLYDLYHFSLFCPLLIIGNQTEVTLRHTGVPDDELGRQHNEGWNWIMSMLAESITSRQSAPAPK